MEKKKQAKTCETPFLPEEITADILTWLPVKSLKRFQCVCKDWKNLFKTPYFIQQHLHHSTHNTSSLVIAPTHPKDDYFLLSFNWELKFREIEIPPSIGSISGLRLVGSSNGLLCFINWNKRPAALSVWNPATREVRRVPIISDDFWGWDWHFEFGFSPIVNDYRIVSFSSRKSVVCKVGVFSLSTGGWRDIEVDNIKDVCLAGQFPGTGHGVTANGVIYFYGSKSIMKRNDARVIVSFDLATEVFTVVPRPAFASYSGKLAVYDDKLAIIPDPQIRSPQIYYKEDLEEEAIGSSGKRWSKKYYGNSKLILSAKLIFSAGTIWRNQIVCIYFGLPTRTEHGVEDIGRLHLIDVNAKRCKWFNIKRPKPGFGVCVCVQLCGKSCACKR